MTLIKSISGIRGTIGSKVGEGLTPFDIVKFTTAYALFLRQRKEGKAKLKVVVGRDARLSGEMVDSIVVGCLLSMGIDVIELGLSTTPTVEMAVIDKKADGGIIITASHNPKQWNALKLLNDRGEFLNAEEGEQVVSMSESTEIPFAKVGDIGRIIYYDKSLDKHINKILSLKLVDVEAIKNAKLRIAVDAVNSFGGVAVPKLLKALGVKNIYKINCEPTGEFAHNPEPLPENLIDLSNLVVEKQADLGIAVDPDVDRLALVDERGEMFGEEYTLVAVADYVMRASKSYKKSVVSNMSSTQALKDVAIRNKYEYFSSAVGEVNVVECMKANNSLIGGEGNGGIIYPQLHSGRDALVGIALFLTHFVKQRNKNIKTVSLLRALYPSYVIAKKKIDLVATVDIDNIFRLIEEKYSKQGYKCSTIDGLKINFDKEWVHLRKSNTEPIIRIYAESINTGKAESLASSLIGEIETFI